MPRNEVESSILKRFVEELDQAIDSYLKDNAGIAIHEQENSALRSLGVILAHLRSLEKNKEQAFSIRESAAIIKRIKTALPPQFLSYDVKAGFLGLMTTQEKRPSKLYVACDYLINELEKSELQYSATPAQTSSSSSASVNTSTTTTTTSSHMLNDQVAAEIRKVMAEQQAKMMESQARLQENQALMQAKMEQTEAEVSKLKEANEKAYSDGKAAGRQEISNQLVRYVKQMGVESSIKGLMEMLALPCPSSVENFSASDNSIQASDTGAGHTNNESSSTSDMESHKQILMKHLTQEKFNVIEKLTIELKGRRYNTLEKLAAKFIIFQLMLHKNKLSTVQVFENCKNTMMNQLGGVSSVNTLEMNFPHLGQDLKMLASGQNDTGKFDIISLLSTAVCKEFVAVTTDGAAYLEKDGTASYVFSGEKKEEDYIQNLVNKLKATLSTQGASAKGMFGNQNHQDKENGSVPNVSSPNFN